MQVGFAVPVSGPWATPDRISHVARRAEELGYASLWTFQRLLWPVDSTGPAAAPYRRVIDPVATLGYLAAITERPRLGVAVLNAPFFAPALLAKQLATVDILSGGRLDVGLGLGWMEQEYVATDTPYERRGDRMDDYLRCLDALWTQDPVDYSGEFYRVPPTHADPKPVQSPRPPIILGGTVPAALRRAGRLADGWVSSSRADLSTIDESIEVVRSGAREAGRDESALRFVVRGVVKLRPAGAADRAPLCGSVDEIRGDLERLAGKGVTEVFIDLNFDPEVPESEPAAAMQRAEEALEAFAPGGGPRGASRVSERFLARNCRQLRAFRRPCSARKSTIAAPGTRRERAPVRTPRPQMSYAARSAAATTSAPKVSAASRATCSGSAGARRGSPRAA